MSALSEVDLRDFAKVDENDDGRPESVHAGVADRRVAGPAAREGDLQ